MTDLEMSPFLRDSLPYTEEETCIEKLESLDSVVKMSYELDFGF